MVIGHKICMGTCPVTQVSFQQSRELSGAVSKSFQAHLLYGLTTQNMIFGLLRPCSHSSISSICRDNLVLKSCLAVTLPHQVMMSPRKFPSVTTAWGSDEVDSTPFPRPFRPFLKKQRPQWGCRDFSLNFRTSYELTGPMDAIMLIAQSSARTRRLRAFICAKNQPKRFG